MAGSDAVNEMVQINELSGMNDLTKGSDAVNICLNL